MEYDRWSSRIFGEAAGIIAVIVAVILFVVVIFHHWRPSNLLYLFFWDLAHQVLFYVGGVLAFLEWFLIKYTDTPIEKKLFTRIVVFLLFVSCFQAWVDEHKNSDTLIIEKANAVGEKEFWKDQSYAKDQDIRNRDVMLGNNIAAFSASQTAYANLSEKVLEISSPAPATIKMRYTSFRTPQKDAEGKDIMLWIVAAITNKSISPFSGILKCDKPVQLFSGRAAVPAHISELLTGPQQVGANTYKIQYSSPAVFEPDTPLLFAILQVEHPYCTFAID